MGWRRICLLTTADQEGLKLARIFQRFSLDENWAKLKISWMGFDRDLKRLIQDIVRFKADVLVIHGRGKNLEIFDAANVLTCPLLITNSVFDGISMENIPPGVLKVSLRKGIPDAHQHVNAKMLSETMALAQTAFIDTVKKLCENAINRHSCEEMLDNRLVRQEVSR